MPVRSRHHRAAVIADEPLGARERDPGAPYKKRAIPNTESAAGRRKVRRGPRPQRDGYLPLLPGARIDLLAAKLPVLADLQP